MTASAVILLFVPSVAKFTVRIKTEAQLKRLRKAAKQRKWSLNQFFLEAAEHIAATSVETFKPSEPNTVESNPLTLNQ